jgi:predicted ATPase
MYVSKVLLKNWKNFKNASTDLSKRTFIIGPNASGKSNFLDAFRFLRDVANVGLGAAIKEREGVSAIRCLAARESPSIALEVTLSSDTGIPEWRYELEINQDSTKRAVVRHERVHALKRNVIVLNRPDKFDHDDPPRLSQTALEQINSNRDFRAVSDFFKSISYQHLVPQVVRDPAGFSGKTVKDDPFGRDLLLRIHGTDAVVRDARLRRIAAVLRRAVPQLKSLSINMDKQGIPHLIGIYEHWRAYGAKQTEVQFSDGTLRLFGLMWSMLDGTGPLLVEEPELSLHPEVVRIVPQLLLRLQQEIRKMKKRRDYADRQILISTHSEDILSDKGIAPNEVVRIAPSPEGKRNDSSRSLVAKVRPDERSVLI